MVQFPPKTLAVDFGTKRVGLALSHGSLAEPWQVLERPDGQTVNELAQKILELGQAEQVEQIVVGISEAQMAEWTTGFVQALRQQTQLPIHLVDETLSSWEAHGQLQAAGQHSPTRRVVDHIAAALILERYLEQAN